MTEEQKKEEISRLYHQLDVCGQNFAEWDEDKEPTCYRREYKRIMKQLAKLEPENWNFPYFKKTDYSKRNEAVAKFCETHFCDKCGGRCKQTRSGSLRIVCLECGTKYQLHVKKNEEKDNNNCDFAQFLDDRYNPVRTKPWGMGEYCRGSICSNSIRLY